MITVCQQKKSIKIRQTIFYCLECDAEVKNSASTTFFLAVESSEFLKWHFIKFYLRKKKKLRCYDIKNFEAKKSPMMNEKISKRKRRVSARVQSARKNTKFTIGGL
uniref:Uncharacterized protein n=1 Tax=Romanomermis culicivorax TaxID=13658 RepID=A0A915I929_ROMCU